MTREEFVNKGREKGFVDNTLACFPEEDRLVGIVDVLLDPTIKVIVVERVVDNVCATAFWNDPKATKVRDGRVSIKA